ncbi:MAG TPA: hypothetical protein VFF71_10715 [Luteimonas sp.]|nr:hypothetical protein [Luteimonas sp.]
MKPAVLMAALLVLASCTYGEQTRVLTFKYAIADDDSKVAILAMRYVLHRPTGIAAFPDGGSPKVTDQAVEVYVVDPVSRKILYRHAVGPPGERGMVGLTAWLSGWQADAVYVKLTGCEPGFLTSYRGCGDERRRTLAYRVSGDAVEPVAWPAPAPRPNTRFGRAVAPGASSKPRAYLVSDDEGVWIRHGMQGPREPLLAIRGQALEEIVD